MEYGDCDDMSVALFQSHHTGIEIEYGDCDDMSVALFQSHHTGIEMMKIPSAMVTILRSSNRTILELKYSQRQPVQK